MCALHRGKCFALLLGYLLCWQLDELSTSEMSGLDRLMDWVENGDVNITVAMDLCKRMTPPPS